MGLIQIGEDLECPDCGRYFDMHPGDTERVGGPCPSDDCPSHHKWTAETAKSWLQKLSPIAEKHGLTLAVVGGVKKRGFSDNDLDLLVDGLADGDLAMFLSEIAQRFGITNEEVPTPGGPVARLFVNDDQEIDLFDSARPTS